MTEPTVFRFDIVGANGTPFRFVYDTAEPDTLRYYDRRYPLAEGELGYGINHMTEDGQACGPVLSVNHINWSHPRGFRGWHDVDAWDVDRATVTMVGDWIEMIKERRS